MTEESRLPTKIFAAIVSFNPDVENVRKAIGFLRSQVDGVFLFDNHSSPQRRNGLIEVEREFSDFMSLFLSPQHENVGVGINYCIKSARAKGAGWIIYFDPDSLAPFDLIEKMMAPYRLISAREQERIGALSPNHTTLKGVAIKRKEAFYINGTIMSGMLIKCSTFDTIGYVSEIISLDGVDGEFCIRMQRAGLLVLFVPSVILTTTIGNPTLRKFFGKTVEVQNQKPYRYYTMSRNFTWMFVRNFGTYIIGNRYWYTAIWAVVIPRYMIKMLIFENRRPEKLKLYLLGTFDGLFGRMEHERLEKILNTYA